MKNKKLTLIGSILMILGLITIGTAAYMRYDGDMHQKALVNNFEKSLKEVKENKNQASLAVVPSEQQAGTVGIITIPKIDLKVAIGEGTDNEALRFAVGHFKGTAMPGEKGNFCVAGHRSYTYNKYFNRLGEIKEGDEILVTTLKGEFKYTVNKIMVVNPEDTYVLDPTNDATITLVTCTPIRIATHRLIIKGQLKEKKLF